MTAPQPFSRTASLASPHGLQTAALHDLQTFPLFASRAAEAPALYQPENAIQCLMQEAPPALHSVSCSSFTPGRQDCRLLHSPAASTVLEWLRRPQGCPAWRLGQVCWTRRELCCQLIVTPYANQVQLCVGWREDYRGAPGWSTKYSPFHPLSTNLCLPLAGGELSS